MIVIFVEDTCPYNIKYNRVICANHSSVGTRLQFLDLHNRKYDYELLILYHGSSIFFLLSCSFLAE